jgi:predicted RNase H-like HicB family nuclease
MLTNPLNNIFKRHLIDNISNLSTSKGINMKFRIIIEQDEDNIFVAECPNLPGVVSQGKTREEAIKNVTDAIKGYLASLKKHNEPI